MDEQQRRILEDLGGTLRGELRFDPLAVAMHACDGSLHRIPPLGIAFPRDRDDVVTLARYSAETRTPLVARGAGTGIAGQAIGSGLVVDFSRFMRRIEWIGEDTVRVQPGVVRDRLNLVLREHGRYFPPDPSNTAVTTIGGMLAVDAAGSHSIRVGSTRDHVSQIETVLSGGAVIEAGTESLDFLRSATNGRTDSESGVASNGNGDPPVDDGAKQTIVRRLATLLAENERLIDERQPPLIRNCAGYQLRGIRSDDRLRLARLLVGSEGTLGLFTAATLHTAPLPAHRGVALLLFGQLESAIRAVQVIRHEQPSACDLLDRRLLSLARDADPRFESMILPAAEAALIVEQTGFGDDEVRERLRRVIAAVRAENQRVVVAGEAYSFEEVEFLWSLPSKVVPLLTRLKGETRPVPFVEDIAVPPEALHEFLHDAQKAFQKQQVTATLYAHAAAGQLHLRPFLAATGPSEAARLLAIAEELYELVFAVGGTISGEHGDGLSRSAWLKRQYGPLYRVFEDVKTLFDPQNLMNPGKILTDDPQLAVRHLRPVATPATVDLQLRWTPDAATEAAARCNSCGHCRTQQPELRMCPFFRNDPQEETSPRAKANLFRDFVVGALSPEDFASVEMKRITELCFNCKQCELECPSNVDVPRMMIEARAAGVAAHGLSRADWILSRAHSFGALGCTLSFVANWAIDNPVARWLLQELVGVARLRKLPRFARRSFLRTVSGDPGRRTRPRRERPAVVYFVDHYANHHDPELARAFEAILRHNGIDVLVPTGQTGSGMAMVSAGDLVAARDVAEQNVRALADYAREGLPIVCTEPAAALCLRDEYPQLLDHPDVGVVAGQVLEAGAYLADLHRQGRLRTDFQPLTVTAGYHTPCHLKALQRGTPLRELLSLIPGLQLRTIEKGCSGMAGAFGLTKANFRDSIRLGWPLISHMRTAPLDVGVTECSSCKMQMEQGTSLATVHPLKLIALAYGLLPEIRQRLLPSNRKLVVT